MIKNNLRKLIFATASLFLGNNLIAQCSIDDLDSLHCSDGTTVTLVGTPSGGNFTGSGVVEGEFDPSLAGTGNHTITYEYRPTKSAYYLRAQTGEPWGATENPTAMDSVFGEGQWNLGEFETLDPAVVFSAETDFVFIDGSDDGALELNDFLSTNLTAIENWVQNGGRLLMNAAPNEGGDINFGFGGTTLKYGGGSEVSSVTVVDTEHKAYLGPYSPTVATMTGGSYAHARIEGTNFSNLLVNSAVDTVTVLCEKSWGAGHVVFGGMTTPNFHSPITESKNWRMNVVDYTANFSSKFYLRTTSAEPWGSSSNPDAMNLAFGEGQWTMDFFESLDPTKVFSGKTAFVFIDGSDGGASELNDFLSANMTLIEDWVHSGGSLFLNAAPNEGGDIDFGFDGSVLAYDSPSSSVTVVDLTHAAYLGPNTPTASTMSGSSYSHAHITGTGFTKLLVNSTDTTNVVLCEKEWGTGNVMMGGMTTSNYHSPATEANNWRANLMVYMNGLFDEYVCIATQEVTVLAPVTISYSTSDELLGTDGNIDISVVGGSAVYTYDWDNDGTGDFDDTEDLSGVTAGTYTVVVKDSIGCSATETIVLNSQVGIDELKEMGIAVYPNPTVDIVTVELDGDFTYTIVNMNGKLVLSGYGINKENIDLETLENGIYLMEVNMNNRSQTIRIVKQ